MQKLGVFKTKSAGYKSGIVGSYVGRFVCRIVSGIAICGRVAGVCRK